MNGLSYEGFQQLLSDESSCRSVLFREGRPYFVLQAQQFERRDLEAWIATATGRASCAASWTASA
jgi:aspartate carbamoyltransferase catalytic subunit